MNLDLTNTNHVDHMIQELQSIKNDPAFKATLNTHEALTKAIEAMKAFKEELKKDIEAG